LETLADRISRDGPVNELDAVGWAIRLAKRLEMLHAMGVFHGSVSPACIVTASAERASPGKLADLRVTAGNLAYQSPERIQGGDLSPADDTWAVAATLFVLLTGTSPFAGASEAETKQKILVASPSPLAVFDVGDDDLQAVIDAAFARDPARRTAKVSVLRQALEAWHPDLNVRSLSPLDEEDDTTDCGDEEKTMMRSLPELEAREPARKAAAAPRPLADLSKTIDMDPPPRARPKPVAGKDARPAPAPVFAASEPVERAQDPGDGPSRAPLASAPRLVPAARGSQPSGGDDDDEEVNTVLRGYPASVTEAARAAAGGVQRTQAMAAMPAAPRPAQAAAPRSAPRPDAAFTGATPSPATARNADADDDDDHTIMRLPPGLTDEDSSDLSETIMRHAPGLEASFGRGGAPSGPTTLHRQPPGNRHPDPPPSWSSNAAAAGSQGGGLFPGAASVIDSSRGNAPLTPTTGLPSDVALAALGAIPAPPRVDEPHGAFPIAGRGWSHQLSTAVMPAQRGDLQESSRVAPRDEASHFGGVPGVESHSRGSSSAVVARPRVPPTMAWAPEPEGPPLAVSPPPSSAEKPRGSGRIVLAILAIVAVGARRRRSRTSAARR
jgi:hypothetical protein